MEFSMLAQGDGPFALISAMSERDVIEACGAQGVRAMVAAFYRRVRHDDVIGPMYPPDDWEQAEERLADFLLFRLGASEAYIQKRGHPRLRMRHVTFKISMKERDRWLLLMGEAMDETGVPEKARAFLEPFFTQVADFLRNRPD